MSKSILTIEADYSSLSAVELLAKVVPQYDVPPPATCEFWHRGLNDTYKLSSEDEIFILRMYRKDWRTRSAISFELEALMYLHQNGAHVAMPIKRKDGEFITSILAPEGKRYAIVTQYAKGQILEFADAEDARVFGQAAAEVHCCSSGFESSYSRDTLDIRHLLEQPMTHIKPYLVHRPSDWEFLTKLAERLSRYTNQIGDTLDYGFCHGDFHGENAHMHHGKITHFDFDCCGFGWRNYDLATFQWVMRLLGKEDKLWPSFLDGYRSVRKLSKMSITLIEPFIAIRDIWYFGLNTGYSLAQGWLDDRYIDIHIDFLKDVAKRLDSGC
ncbi:MAG: phosphotransferase enzyme family protein [Leptolyngbyaceae cyanobacterium]